MGNAVQDCGMKTEGRRYDTLERQIGCFASLDDLGDVFVGTDQPEYTISERESY
jgi:hypothetical protein